MGTIYLLSKRRYFERGIAKREIARGLSEPKASSAASLFVMPYGAKLEPLDNRYIDPNIIVVGTKFSFACRK